MLVVCVKETIMKLGEEEPGVPADPNGCIKRLNSEI